MTPTIRRIVLFVLVLVLSILIVLMILDEPASAHSNLPTTLSKAGGIGMLATLCSLGGFLVGGGAVYIYAKATHQEIEWRGVPGVRRIYFYFNTTQERRAH